MQAGCEVAGEKLGQSCLPPLSRLLGRRAGKQGSSSHLGIAADGGNILFIILLHFLNKLLLSF